MRLSMSVAVLEVPLWGEKGKGILRVLVERTTCFRLFESV